MRRRRRKTVTFDEQCDVVEFDAEEHEHEQAGYDDMDVDREEEEMDMQIDELDSDPHPQDDFALDAEDSLTGMVNSMLHHQSQSPTTPPKRVGYGLRDDEESAEGEPEQEEDDDDIPLGRKHSSPPPQYPFRSNTSSPPTTPPKPSPLAYNNPYSKNGSRVTSPSPLSQSYSPSHANMTTTAINFSPTAFSPPPTTTTTDPPTTLSPGTHIPLGRTTHAERLRAKREEEEEVEKGVQGLEGSPSPIKGRKEGLALGVGGGLVPRFGVRVMGGMGIGVRDDEDDGTFFLFACLYAWY